MNTPFPVIPYLTTIAINYRNRRLIADAVMPRVSVGNQTFRYKVYDLRDAFTIQDTKVGRTSQVNQVEFQSTETPGLTRDYALDGPVPYADVQNAANSNYDPEARATELVTDLVALDREVRVAGMTFNAANYAAANKSTLTNPWSDKTLGTPLTDILTAMDSMLMRPNKLVLGRAVMTSLSTHPQIVKAFFGNQGDSGIVPTSFLAQLFGLDEVLVGESFLNTAARGQTASVSRVWGKFAALLYVNPLADVANGMTWGLTAQWGPRIAGKIADPDMGMRGGTRVRVGESVGEVIEANDLGYLFSNATA